MKESKMLSKKNKLLGKRACTLPPSEAAARREISLVVKPQVHASAEHLHRLHAAVDALLTELVRQEIGRRKGQPS